MTNFQPSDGRRRLITPEQIAFWWPIASGAALLVLVVLVAYPPMLGEFQKRRTAIAELKSQEEMLPLLRSQLKTGVEQTERLSRQQTRLLTLVAGTGDLKTWLAGINDLAAATGLAVTQVEPGAVVRYSPPPSEVSDGITPTPAQGQQPATPADPLLAPNLEKRSAQITVRGTYRELRTFLQQLETLQVVAIASELQLKAATPMQEPSQGQPPAKALTELTLTVSAYGRAPAQPESVESGNTQPAG